MTDLEAGSPRAFRVPWRAVVLAVLIVILSVSIYFSPAREWIDAGRLTRWLDSMRGYWWTPLVFFGLYVVFDIFLLPVTFLSIAAALVWGWKVGGTIELISCTLAALAPYVIARSVAPGWLEERLARRGFVNHGHLREKGFILLLLLRFVPVIPYVVLNYICGFARVAPREFLVTTLLGTIPSTFIFAYFVDAMAAGMLTQEQVLMRVLGAGVMLGALVVALAVGSDALRRRL